MTPTHPLFDGGTIVACLIDLVRCPTTRYVIGCAAWLTHPDIIMSLKEVQCTIICNTPFSVATTRQYAQIRPYVQGVPAIIVIPKQACPQHGLETLVHHKFLIGMDATHHPRWALNGSLNFTNHACCNHENATFIFDGSVQNLYVDEFLRILTRYAPNTTMPSGGGADRFMPPTQKMESPAVRRSLPSTTAHPSNCANPTVVQRPRRPITTKHADRKIWRIPPAIARFASHETKAHSHITASNPYQVAAWSPWARGACISGSI